MDTFTPIDDSADAPGAQLESAPPLFENEAGFHSLFTNNPLPMWVYDLETLAFLEVNNSAVAIYGYSYDEFLQMRLPDIQPPETIQPDNLFPEGPHSSYGRYRTKAGQLIEVEVTSQTLVWAGRPAALIVAHDITGHKRAEEAPQESIQQIKIAYEQATIYARELNTKIAELSLTRQRLQLLSQQLVEAQEAERRHIARELHDEIGQTLTAVKINLQAMQRLSHTSSLAIPLAESMDIIEQAIQQVRNLSLDLRPSMLDDLGLLATLRWYLDRQAKWAGFITQFTADPPDMQLPSNLETVCFRLVQEALTNVMRHAQAQRVQINLQQHQTELELFIQDDGLGFEVEATLARVAHGTGLGLLGMQERVALLGGQLDINSAPGRGVEIRVCLPLSPRDGYEK
jgi:PAS domain S-box-containing protein